MATRGERSCVHCGETFQTDHGYGPTPKYCSRSCGGRATSARYRKRHPDAHREWRLPERYGITLEEYRAMAQEQGNCCAICGRPEEIVMRGRVKPLSVDHDHRTGQVRGLLCDYCNVGLGKFKDNPDSLRAAAAYLERAWSVAA